MLKDSLSLEHFRHRLGHVEALPQLITLGVLAGLVTGLLVIAFRLLVDHAQDFLIADGGPEGFEALSPILRWVYPIVGALILAAILVPLSPKQRRTGPVHVLERLSYHQGVLPASNLFVQFWGAAIALISGHSVGREGPAIHLGAAASSLLGQSLRLPHNSIRLLVGCGTAAAISAAFNTPLAGVIFAMEVVLLEYTVIGFTPVVVAAVSADVIVRLTIGAETSIRGSMFQIETLSELPWVMLIGVCTGAAAAAFTWLLTQTSQKVKLHLAIKLLIAGFLVGATAQYYPQVMGVGYDTINDLLTGEHTLLLLCGLLLAKGLLTPIILGLGIPGGLIGPSLFIGAVIGAILGIIGDAFAQQQVSHTGFYAMLGMGAMMAALLNAPLAALMAMLELTANPNIILPGMLAIVVSNTTMRYVFKYPSVFITSLNTLGLDYRHEPLSQALSRRAVVSSMDRSIALVPYCALSEDISKATDTAQWLIFEKNHQLSAIRTSSINRLTSEDDHSPYIDLSEAAIDRHDLRRISYRATLNQALEKMNRHNIDALAVSNLSHKTIGIITRETIELSYRSNN
ncbi:MAG: chloride channel protein [Pontibacterium sp.]